MRIEIDGREPKAPNYAKLTSLDENFYISALNASLVGFGPYKQELKQGVQDLADTLKKDPNHKEIIADCLRAGSTKIQSWHFEYLSSGLANMLAKEGDYLEMVDKRDPKQVKIETAKKVGRKDFINESSYETRIGQSLSNGRLVFRGNLDTISNLSGGSIFVEGNVKKIEQTGSGIIFVDGNVDSIDEAEQTVIAITGTLKKYREYRIHQRGAREGSPYIFASKIGEVDRDLYKGQKNDVSPLEYPIEVDLKNMKGWDFSSAFDASFKMAQNAAVVYAENILDFAKNASNASDLGKFARLQMFAYILGRQSGYFAGSLESTPASAYD